MPIKLLGHRLHPMFVSFPIGLLGGSVAFDLAYLATENARWADIAFAMIGLGIVSGLVAAPFGSIDWLAIPSGTRAKRVGLLHGATAFLSVGLFAASWWLRYNASVLPSAPALLASFTGVALLSLAAWLGGELVECMGIGVNSSAHPNSPSSLSKSHDDKHAKNRTSVQAHV
jgi:uncharacterized membrane protein